MENNFRSIESFDKPQEGQIYNIIKTTNATYKLLDFFPDSDPLKNKAKEKVLAIMENLTLISDTKGWISLKKEKAAAELLDDIDVLEAYLKLAKYQGWIGNINFLIITKEYNLIRSKINPPKGAIKRNLETTLDFERNENLERYKKQNDLVLDETVVLGGELTHNNNHSLSDHYSERQKKILQILEKVEKAQVSDIIRDLPNVTKRTIRRDLDDLLKRDKIVRIGEWNQVFYKNKRDSVSNHKNNSNSDRTIFLS